LQGRDVARPEGGVEMREEIVQVKAASDQGARRQQIQATGR
jgi:hypothetical protein